MRPPPFALPPLSSLRVLDAHAWRPMAEQHKQRVLSLCDPSNIDRRHPIFNFIFTYYAFDPKLLLRFSPGTGVLIEGVGVDEPDLWCGKGWLPAPNGGRGTIDHRLCSRALRRAAPHAEEVMRASSRRAPHYNCFGLHEWAMLYGEPGEDAFNRHQDLPLRVSQDELNRIVEAHPLRCTHFDAFRFFTTVAAPRNTVEPTPSRRTQSLLEQPGCVHASMDLFRYSIKLWPWCPSALVADALELAIEARLLDMRASPYDLSEFDGARGGQGVSHPGFDLSPVRIETEKGRREYQLGQQALAERAAPIRARLLREYTAAALAWAAQDAAEGRAPHHAQGDAQGEEDTPSDGRAAVA